MVKSICPSLPLLYGPWLFFSILLLPSHICVFQLVEGCIPVSLYMKWELLVVFYEMLSDSVINAFLVEPSIFFVMYFLDFSFSAIVEILAIWILKELQNGNSLFLLALLDFYL